VDEDDSDASMMQEGEEEPRQCGDLELARLFTDVKVARKAYNPKDKIREQ
jgi:hypothetical protein